MGSYAMKYENGKNRALFPTDNITYVMLSYILR